MELLLILYSIFASSVLIWCTLQQPNQVEPKQLVHYVVISAPLFHDWRRAHSDLVAIDLRDQVNDPITGALHVLPNQLGGLLRWIPPKTTLALCGIREAERCRYEIQPTLLQVGISMVYIVDTSASASKALTSPLRARV